VLAIDYRGYGDSSSVILSEKTVVEDARAALAWIQEQAEFKAKVVVYGKSLGTSIASHMVAEFGGNSSVDGLILEAPFNNMYDEVMTFHVAKAASWIVDVRAQLSVSGCIFDSDKWLPRVKAPVLILHAEDDNVVPYSLVKKLYESALEVGKKNIRFITFGKHLTLGHMDIYRAENIETELKKFIDK
jgi:alpha-beta hydrolase superfamily lysophospholipase